MDILKSKPLLVSLTLSLFLSACGGDGSNSNDTPSSNTYSELETNANIAENFVNNLAIPAYQNFINTTNTLPSTVENYCNSISTSNQNTQLKTAQEAWVTIKNDWLATNMYQVGPLADETGIKLIESIYKKNRFSASTEALLNKEIKALQDNSKYTLTDSVDVSARGIDALEMLLFSNKFKDKNSCNYAVAVAKDIKQKSQDVLSTWKSKKSNFLAVKTTTGVDVVKPFFDRVVLLADKDLKDAQLGVPLSLKAFSTCKDICPELVEHPISKTSYDSIKVNLENLKEVFTGNGGAGFVSFYNQKKLQTEAQIFEGHINSALAIIESQKTSLYSQINTIKTNNKQTACNVVVQDGKTTDKDLAPCQLYYHVKQISDDIKKGSFKIAVNLKMPSSVAGDGD